MSSKIKVSELRGASGGVVVPLTLMASLLLIRELQPPIR